MSTPSIVLYGHAHISQPALDFSISHGEDFEFDVRPYLKEKKNFKFLSRQDALALGAASLAWNRASIPSDVNRDRCGVYLCSGILPFEDAPLTKLHQLSENDGQFDMGRFSADAFHSMNPILTFKCLPSMPVFHISHNVGLTGPYFVTYPGIGEWFSAFQMAVDSIRRGDVDYALVGAVVDQRNFLVRHHISRIGPEWNEKTIDAAAFWVIGKEESTSRGVAVLDSMESSFTPFSPFENPERLLGHDGHFQVYAGATSPLLYTNLMLMNSKPRSVDYVFANEGSGCSFRWVCS